MRVAVVGGGFSGALLLTQLLRARPGVEVTLIERSGKPGRGIAYSTTDPRHILNVPAGKISAFPDQPSHFLDWLHANGHHYEADAFAPRKLFGDYVSEVLSQAGGFRCVQDDAVDLDIVGDELRVRTKAGEVIACDKAVLAVGNWRPGDPSVPDTSFYSTPSYVRDPRDEVQLRQALATVAKDDPLLIVGSGLTMIDLVLTLRDSGHRGVLHVLSRRGLLPQRHQKTDPFTWDAAELQGNVREVVKAVRRKAEEVIARGGDWRCVVDALRPHNQLIWQSFSAADKRRFLRHMQAFWDIHRHRVSSQVHDHLFEMFRSGRLVLHAGRLMRFEETDGLVTTTYRSRNTATLKEISSKLVFNCTGPETNYRKVRSPIIANLLEKGLIDSDPLHVGLLATPTGALIDAQGRVSTQLFTIGPPLKGILWETTAVPEIRVQAVNLAQELLRQ